MSPHTIRLDNIQRSIAVISDTHIFSDFGLVPREPVEDEHGAIRNPREALNDGQRIIQSYWYDQWLPTCDEFNVDTVIHLGDACQGINPKEGGRSTLSPDLDIQKEAAALCLEPLVKDRNLEMFNGTTYHEALNTRIHQDIANRLRGYAQRVQFHGKFANLSFDGTNKVANCAHAATSAMIYPAGVIDRELLFIKVAVAEGKIPRPDYFFRGHLHKYIHLDYEDIHGIQCPGWQAWYPLGDKVRLYGRTQPDIGGLILLIDKENRTILLHFLYEAPKIADCVKRA